MAKRAEKELYRYLVKGFLEFGEFTANRFAATVAGINEDLSRYPETGFPEPLLRDRKRLYRPGIYLNASNSSTIMQTTQIQYMW